MIGMSVSFLTMVVLEKGSGSDGDSPILTNIFIGSNILWVGAVVADMFEYGTSPPLLLQSECSPLDQIMSYRYKKLLRWQEVIITSYGKNLNETPLAQIKEVRRCLNVL